MSKVLLTLTEFRGSHMPLFPLTAVPLQFCVVAAVEEALTSEYT